MDIIRDMQIHRLITLSPRVVFLKSRTTSFDLYATAGFLLDMFDISTTLANNLRTKIETIDGV